MKTLTKTIPLWLLSTVVILLFLVVFVNVVHASLGRYTSIIGEEIKFAPSAKGVFEITEGEWRVSEQADEQTLTVSVAGDADWLHAASFGVRVYISGAEDTLPDLALHHNGAVYEAFAEKIPPNTAASATYGEGQVCCFYSQGHEMYFEIDSNANEPVEMTLVLKSRDFDTSGVCVVVEPVNSQNGGDRL